MTPASPDACPGGLVHAEPAAGGSFLCVAGATSIRTSDHATGGGRWAVDVGEGPGAEIRDMVLDHDGRLYVSVRELGAGVPFGEPTDVVAIQTDVLGPSDRLCLGTVCNRHRNGWARTFGVP